MFPTGTETYCNPMALHVTAKTITFGRNMKSEGESSLAQVGRNVSKFLVKEGGQVWNV